MGFLGIGLRIGLFVLLIIAIMLSPLACTSYDDNIDHYSRDVEEYKADLFMPALDSIGEYTSAAYRIKKDEGVFPHYSLRLIVQYEEAEFLAEKQRLETEYTYLDEPQMSDDCYEMPVIAFSTAGFDFRIAVFEDTIYPKNFGMVGISDEKCQIAYLWQYDPDLDYICEKDEDRTAEMIEFLNYHFGMDEL
ncbi:MAG: hypothetical protein IJZ15_03305 [Oscillospiraceae bacterium]|nr:hypothetical protein [Oscillospiraceae bacterium]